MTEEDIEKLERFKEATICYVESESTMGDFEYETLKKELVSKGILEDKYWMEYYNDFTNKVNGDISLDEEDLLSYPSKSIEPVRTIEEAYRRAKNLNGLLCCSAKIDGTNLRIKQEGSKALCAITKGRAGRKFFNVTDGVNKCGKLKDMSGYNMFEAFVFNKELKKHPYYSTSRGCALSLLRFVVGPTTDANLAFIGRKEYDSLYDLYEEAESKGYFVPPHIRIHSDDITSIEVFKDIMRQIWEASSDYMTDGMVVKLDDYSRYKALGGDDNYDFGGFAVKAGYWSQSEKETIVTDILVQTKGSNGSVKLKVEPINFNGTTITTVNMYNLANVINNNIKVGDRICVTYKSNTTPEFVKNIEVKNK